MSETGTPEQGLGEASGAPEAAEIAQLRQELEAAQQLAAQQRDQMLAHYRLYVKGFLDIDGVDAVEYTCPAHGLIRTEVHGRPEVFRSASGRLDHTAVSLREVRG